MKRNKKMETTDLRVFNTVKCSISNDHAIYHIRQIDGFGGKVLFTSTIRTEWIPIEKVKPVPLTEEILLKCGCTKLSENHLFIDRFSLHWMEAYKYWYVTDLHTKSYITKVEFLNEWQNTFFVLQGQELEVSL